MNIPLYFCHFHVLLILTFSVIIQQKTSEHLVRERILNNFLIILELLNKPTFYYLFVLPPSSDMKPYLYQIIFLNDVFT